MPTDSDGLQALEGCEVCLWKNELMLGCRNIEKYEEKFKAVEIQKGGPRSSVDELIGRERAENEQRSSLYRLQEFKESQEGMMSLEEGCCRLAVGKNLLIQERYRTRRVLNLVLECWCDRNSFCYVLEKFCAYAYVSIDVYPFRCPQARCCFLLKGTSWGTFCFSSCRSISFF